MFVNAYSHHTRLHPPKQPRLVSRWDLASNIPEGLLFRLSDPAVLFIQGALKYSGIGQTLYCQERNYFLERTCPRSHCLYTADFVFQSEIFFPYVFSSFVEIGFT